MASPSPQAPSSRTRLMRLAAASLIALSTAACLNRQPPETTGAIGNPADQAAAARSQLDGLAKSYDAKPTDPARALAYSRALRASDQHAQAVAVLQQATIRNPKNFELLGAYGKSLADVGRYREAAEVLSRAHTPERPDWRVLSAQGAVADQMGEPAEAQRYYEAALKIVPDEPSVLSNLGLSFALSKRLAEGERVLRSAVQMPGADARVRQNLALVLGLQGRFNEAEDVLKADLGPAEAAANVAAMRGFVSQPNSWSAIRQADGEKKPQRPKS